eukprot:334774-Chlamydomonas_euryale.AAC.1
MPPTPPLPTSTHSNPSLLLVRSLPPALASAPIRPAAPSPQDAPTPARSNLHTFQPLSSLGSLSPPALSHAPIRPAALSPQDAPTPARSNLHTFQHLFVRSPPPALAHAPVLLTAPSPQDDFASGQPSPRGNGGGSGARSTVQTPRTRSSVMDDKDFEIQV